MKRALIIGVNGQDGAYLAKHLLDLDYEVYGGARRSSSGGTWRLDRLGIRDRVVHLCVDVLDEGSVIRAIEHARPDEIYNLAAQGHVGDSWAVPSYTLSANSTGALNVFLHMGPAKVFQASTLSVFGNGPCPETGYDEDSPVRPADPYGASKAAAQHFAHLYRDRGRFIACGLLGNHESPLRPDTFVTQKIAKGVARWQRTGEPFELFNLTGVRDWGWAPEYVEAMHLMLQRDVPEDFVIATGIEASVGDFVKAAIGSNIHSLGPICKATNHDDDKSPRCFGNPAKAKSLLGWVPRVHWAEIARRMVEAA